MSALPIFTRIKIFLNSIRRKVFNPIQPINQRHSYKQSQKNTAGIILTLLFAFGVAIFTHKNYFTYLIIFSSAGFCFTVYLIIGNPSDRIKEYLKILKNFMIAIAIPIIALVFSNNEKEKVLGKEYIQIGLGILDKPANDNSIGLRKWAIEMINHYGDIEMDDSLKKQLLTTSLRGIYKREEEWDSVDLDVARYRNDTIIQYAKDSTAWKRFGVDRVGCYCYLNFDSANKAFGKYYNYYALESDSILAPEGKMIVWMDLFKKLIYDYGFPKDPRVDEKKWVDLLGKPGDKELTQLFSGYVDSDGHFQNVNTEARWWTINNPKVGSRRQYYYYSITSDSVTWNYTNKKYGYHVRCIKEPEIKEEDI